MGGFKKGNPSNYLSPFSPPFKFGFNHSAKSIPSAIKLFLQSFLWKCLFPSRGNAAVRPKDTSCHLGAELNESRVVFSIPPPKIWVFLGFLGQFLGCRQSRPPISPEFSWVGLENHPLPPRGGPNDPPMLRIMAFLVYIYIYIYIYI